jgi:hypothetical protein
VRTGISPVFSDGSVFFRRSPENSEGLAKDSAFHF